MLTSERINAVAPCGIDCGICELFTCGDNPALIDAFVQRGIPRHRLPCPGCRAVNGTCPVLPTRCSTHVCAMDRGVTFCFECESFPCDRLHPAADRASVLPHNLKVFNLCTIRRVGVPAFIAQSQQIRQRYNTGKMKVGSGPQLDADTTPAS